MDISMIPTVRTISTTTKQRKDCIFCTIACGKDPLTKLLYEDERHVAFRNITPAASHHYLIIPKDHIKDGNSLTRFHIQLVRRLEEIGKKVLVQNGGDLRDFRVGFHWPPFTSVPHLHLHVISPEKEMSLRSKVLFRPGTRWFVTPQEVITRLKRTALTSSL